MHRLAWLLALVMAGCYLTIDESKLTGGAQAKEETDAGDEAAAALPDGEAPSPDAADGGLDGAPAKPACLNGARIAAKTAFDLGIDGGLTCNVENVLVQDGQLAGLDRLRGEEMLLDGKRVTGCIGVDFGAVVQLTGVRVLAAPSASACGAATPCLEGSDAGCGTGRTLGTYAGLDRASLTKGDVITAIEAPGEYTARFAAARDVQVVAICREGWGSDRDDVNVDVITGVCE
ncbi:MAG: hypothetical protein KIT84_14395 [Labilithrix sp.]|nr:hypothetical protein [Labilithrix sp.]MCW5812211.1 hypothetical protein [Labilithrix sp.]